MILYYWLNWILKEESEIKELSFKVCCNDSNHMQQKTEKTNDQRRYAKINETTRAQITTCIMNIKKWL